MKEWIWLLFFFFCTGVSASAQKSKVDTSSVQIEVDSCAALQDSRRRLECMENVLARVKRAITPATTEKEKKNFQDAELSLLRNIGNLYTDFRDYPKAVQTYRELEKKAAAAHHVLFMAAANYNIGKVYGELNEYHKSLNAYQTALAKFEELQHRRGSGMSLNGIGNCYNNLSQFDKAFEFYEKSIKVQVDTLEITSTFYNMGDMFKKRKSFSNAVFYFEKSLALSENISDYEGMAHSYIGIGEIRFEEGNLKEAEEKFSKALMLAKRENLIEREVVASKALRKIFEKQGKYREALYINDTAVALNDSLTRLQRKEEIERMDLKNEFEKKESLAKAEHEKELAQAEEEKKRQRLFLVFVIAVAAAVAIIAVVIFRSLKVTRKQKQIIEHQKSEVDHKNLALEEANIEIAQKNKDITDSIRYAQRLQQAILPPEKLWKQQLPESFILYKPKDIVAGDFYWMEHLNGKILFAAADCTGHGVPGAMVSVVCSNALNNAVKEFHLTDPGKILDKATQIILSTFEKSESEVKDGMDISLCCFDVKTNELAWAGANNPIWYLQNGELFEIAPDKQPVGRTDNPRPFKTNSVQLKKGDSFYTFTDGYADQFGGPKGKKFKYKQLEDLILSNVHLPMQQQKNILDNAIEDWKGDLEQIDDVLVIGVKI